MKKFILTVLLVALANLYFAYGQSCGNCYMELNNVWYYCPDCNINMNNNVCVCGNGQPCPRCSGPNLVAEENIVLKSNCYNMVNKTSNASETDVMCRSKDGHIAVASGCNCEKGSIQANWIAAGRVITDNWALGGVGAKGLAESVVKACEQESQPRQLYELHTTIQAKIETIATKIYGASGVAFSEEALQSIGRIEGWGHGFVNLPVCMAKTQYSLSHDPEVKGVPAPFVLPVRDVVLRAGAGFITVMCGSIQTMPGLPTRPAFYDIDLDTETNAIVGIF